MIENADVVCLNDVSALPAGLFFINDDGALICRDEQAFRFNGASKIIAAFNLSVSRRDYRRNGGKPAPTRTRQFRGAEQRNESINSKMAGRLLALGGLYNGNPEGFRKTAEQLGGDAPAGYKQVLNDKTKGLAIAGVSIAAGLGVGRLNTAHTIDELPKTDALIEQKVSSGALKDPNHHSGEKGNWNKDLNNPKPNSFYLVDGDKFYKTDSLARPIQVEATLSPNVKERNSYQQSKAGKSGIEGDEGGHLIASIFNGPGERLNLVPMDGNLNKDAWKKMENTWAKALNEGKKVEVNIQPSYVGDSVRPDKFYVEYSINNERPIAEIFKNAPGGK